MRLIFYVPESTLAGIFRHELRAIIGSAINCYLTWDFLKFSTDPKGPGAGALLKNLIEKDPDWLQQYISNSVKNRGFWVLPRGLATSGLKGLRKKNVILDSRSYLIVIFRYVIRLPICLVANQKIKNGNAIGFW